MSYLKTLGIVIKQTDVGEADRILTILTESSGKIQVWAKGARRPRSKLLASSQLFCASNFVLFKSKDSWQFNSAEVVETFFNLRTDIEKLTYASHLLQLVNDVVQENQKANKVLRLLLNSLYFISNADRNSDRNPELVVHIFEIKLMVLLGLMPLIKNCSSCSNVVTDLVREGVSDFFFDMEKGLMLCGNCCVPAKGLFPLSNGAAMAVYHIVCAPIEKVFSFNVDENVLRELGVFCRSYLSKHLERDYKGLDFLKVL